MFDNLFFKFFGFKDYETRLLRCQSYETGNILKWKKQTKLSWRLTKKLLKNIYIYDSKKIRNVLNRIFQDNQEIFNTKNLYITSFGSDGKSGGKISYEFRHTELINEDKFIESWRLSDLPEGSTVIFVEDLIGTGTQSTKYILEKLNLMLNPSYKPYLLTICATPEGIEKVKDETNFEIINGVLLKEEEYYNYSDKCANFTKSEKNKLLELNSMLKNPNKFDYDRGLLVSFFYSPPNNSMPILWKSNYSHSEKTEWSALIPRIY